MEADLKRSESGCQMHGLMSHLENAFGQVHGEVSGG